MTFNPNNVVSLFIVYELDRWSQDLNTDFTLNYCLFGAVMLTKNSEPGKHSYLGYGIEFNSYSLFPYPGFDCDKNVVDFGLYHSSSVHSDNKKKRYISLR